MDIESEALENNNLKLNCQRGREKERDGERENITLDGCLVWKVSIFFNFLMKKFNL